VDKYPEIERGLAVASGCEKYASLADFSLGSHDYLAALAPSQGSLVAASRYARWKMVVHLSDGDADGAVDLGRQVVRLARLCESEPGLVSYLLAQGAIGRVADGIYDALAQGPVSVETREALDDELAKYEDPLRLARALRLERGISASMSAERGHGLPVGLVSSVFLKLTGWTMNSYFVNALDLYDHQIDLSARPWFEVNTELDGRRSGPPSSGRGALADALLPALRAAHQAHSRSLATLRALRVLSALTQYRVEHGREAKGLADLSLPKETTIDPFSGEPLKMFLADDGWVIYSVLANRVDDGGFFGESLDAGVAPRGPRRAQN
jgi:hypothetical protein